MISVIILPSVKLPVLRKNTRCTFCLSNQMMQDHWPSGIIIFRHQESWGPTHPKTTKSGRPLEKTSEARNVSNHVASPKSTCPRTRPKWSLTAGPPLWVCHSCRLCHRIGNNAHMARIQTLLEKRNLTRYNKQWQTSIAGWDKMVFQSLKAIQQCSTQYVYISSRLDQSKSQYALFMFIQSEW